VGGHAERPDRQADAVAQGYVFFARDGCTRFGSPGIFGKFGGYGASPTSCASSRSTHSSETQKIP
jgi:hypothetical protein